MPVLLPSSSCPDKITDEIVQMFHVKHCGLCAMRALSGIRKAKGRRPPTPPFVPDPARKLAPARRAAYPPRGRESRVINMPSAPSTIHAGQLSTIITISDPD